MDRMNLMTARPWLLLLFTVLCVPPAHAMGRNDCGDALARYLDVAYPGAALDGRARILPGPAGDRIAADDVACRQWPADPGRTLLAVRIVPATEADPDLLDTGSADLEVLVVDSATGEVHARRREAGRLGWDAIRVTGLQLDTARYRLDDEVLAFGVRIDRTGSSRANPWQETSLDLFVLEDGLERVLGNLQVASSGGEWDTVCAGSFHAVERVVSVQPQAAGWSRLRVTSRTRDSRGVPAGGGDCEQVVEATDASTVVLRPDDRRYPVPATLSGVDDW
jgi:hypothetical protein